MSHTLEHKRKISEGVKRAYLSGEPQKKISARFKGIKLTEEHKKKISSSHFGIKPSDATRDKLRLAKLGTRRPLEIREKISRTMKSMREQNHLWKGGIYPINKAIRKSLEYKLWREAVFKRDNFQCVLGGIKHGNKLHADHIKKFCDYPELRFAIDNGRTLCIPCHQKTETWGSKNNNN